MPAISIVVPVYEDDEPLRALSDGIDALARYATAPREGEQGIGIEVIVVDGGASDAARVLCSTRAYSYLAIAPSRGAQIAAGCERAQGDLIWILHADTLPSDAAWQWLCALVSDGKAERVWGRFDIDMRAANDKILNMVATFMNWRSRLTKICTGDQGMFVSRSLLAAVGGHPVQRLMEDIELSKRLKAAGGAVFLTPRARVAASARRWQTNGAVKTILKMWWLRLRYLLGVSPDILAAAYYPKQHERPEAAP